MHAGGDEAAAQIERQVTKVAEVIFHVVAKNPQCPHIEDQMQPGSVQEHGAEQRNEGAGQRYVAAYMERRRQPRRQYSKLHDENIAVIWR